MLKNSNPTKALRLFADVQDRLYRGCTIRNALVEMIKYTQDAENLKTCTAIESLLGLEEIIVEFKHEDRNRYLEAVKTLKNHHAWVLEKYKILIQEIQDAPTEWTQPLLSLTDARLARLSQLIPLLEAEPNLKFRPNDLVVVPCVDSNGNDYEHYGVVRATPKGYQVAHFFTGETIKPKGRLTEAGVGYIHFTSDLSIWQFKERPKNESDTQIENRIQASMNLIRDSKGMLWKQLTYNCEHWARDIVYGRAYSTQVDNLRKRQRKDAA
jgi:hypothetical protein